MRSAVESGWTHKHGRLFERPGVLHGGVRRHLPWVLSTCLLVGCLFGCADLEAPIREYPAGEWLEWRSTAPEAEWEVTPPGTVEVVIVERGRGKGMFGHAAIHIGRDIYSWDYSGGYVLVRQSFRSFLRRYGMQYNRSAKGIVIEFSDEAIQRLLQDLDEECRKAYYEDYKHRGCFLRRNCSTLVCRALVKASGRERRRWPPILLPSWMGRNVQRSFHLLYYNSYQRAHGKNEPATRTKPVADEEALPRWSY